MALSRSRSAPPGVRMYASTALTHHSGILHPQEPAAQPASSSVGPEASAHESQEPSRQPSSPPSLVNSEASTVSSTTFVRSHCSPPLRPFIRRPLAAASVGEYSRTFTSRLLGFPQTISDPAAVASYFPDTGLSHTLWTPPTPAFMANFIPQPGRRLEIYVDMSCIIISIAGRLNSTGNGLTYGIFHGPGSNRNLSGVVPLSLSERTHTRTRLHAELYAAERALRQVLQLLTATEKEWPQARNIIIVTDSRRIMHALASCVYTWKANGWTRARGKKSVSNAAAWKMLVELVEEVETFGVGVRVWTVGEAANADATRLAVGAIEAGEETPSPGEHRSLKPAPRVQAPLPPIQAPLPPIQAPLPPIQIQQPVQFPPSPFLPQWAQLGWPWWQHPPPGMAFSVELPPVFTFPSMPMVYQGACGACGRC